MRRLATSDALNVAAAFAVALGVAARAASSEIVPMGNGNYMVSSTSHGVLGGSGSEGADTARQANAYCGKSGRHAIIDRMDKEGPGLQAGVGIAITATAYFRCDQS